MGEVFLASPGDGRGVQVSGMRIVSKVFLRMDPSPKPQAQRQKALFTFSTLSKGQGRGRAFVSDGPGAFLALGGGGFGVCCVSRLVLVWDALQSKL